MALICLALLFCPNVSAFSQNAVADYLCEIGKNFYAQGRSEEALTEFNKALLVESDNQVAKDYINRIFAANSALEATEALNPALKVQAQTPVAKPAIIAPVVKKAQTKTPAVAKAPIRAPVVMKAPAPGVATKAQAQNLAFARAYPQTPVAKSKASAPAVEKAQPQTNQKLAKEEAMEQDFAKLNTQQSVVGPNQYNDSDLMPKKEERGIKAGPLKITGEAQLSFGVTPHDFIWKRANFDLNEKFLSWRMLSNDVFNHGFNTYDPAVYDSLSFNLDTENKEGFNFHTNITVDPWSFTGKSPTMTVDRPGDIVEDIQLYYWSNTGHILNHTYYGGLKGLTLNIPELKVIDGKTTTTLASSYFIPASKIDMQFQPVRELWLDYTNDQIKLRAFPMAYQDQAYSSDDPLNISNHGIWWKDSKWLRMYTPGVLHTGNAPADFTKGHWDDSLSFISKDSTGKYLTALRGFSFSFQPQEATTFDTTVATPKSLWQDYDVVDNIISASRLKHKFTDNLAVGTTLTSRFGFRTDPQKLDSRNFVGGADLSYEIIDGLKAQAEVLTSKSDYDLTNSDYRTQSQGNAYYFSFITRYPRSSIMDLKYGYDDIALAKDESFLIKSKFYASKMDRSFDSSLSDFHNTRQDVAWSRHLHFRKPMDYYGQGLEGSNTNWSELNATRIGDGIDIGRETLGFRFETFLEDRFINLFDVRNVHSVEGKFIENVVRDEATVRLTDKLTAKALGIYQKLPKTVAGIDPYIYDGNTGEFFINDAVAEGADPTIETGSIGLNYDFFDWLSLNGIYERTNDYTLAYGNFPQDILKNDTTIDSYYYQNDKYYSHVVPFLFGQGIFPQAPYDFYNVYKAGLRIMPLKNLEVYLDYTRNEYEAASLINDNMNHVGMEVTYMPTPKLGMSLKYIYSRSKDIYQLPSSDFALTDHPVGHHNFFSEIRYMPSKDDELIMQYGVGDTSSIGNISSLDPYGGSMLTLDTQQIIRAYYRRRF
jgi:hypothetical protein